jgi:AcrR family transcriptional regulator
MSPKRAKAVRGRGGDDPATALREHLIDAAERLLADRPVPAITTRELARTAGVSDGVLYNYFQDKNDLLLTALVRRYQRLADRFTATLPAAGTGTVAANLLAIAEAMLDLDLAVLPVFGGLMSEQPLLHRFFAEIHRPPYGAQLIFHTTGDYLQAEQRLGRLPTAAPEPAITLFTGAIAMLALSAVLGGRPAAALTAELPPIVHTLLTGIATAPAEPS